MTQRERRENVASVIAYVAVCILLAVILGGWLLLATDALWPDWYRRKR